MTYNVIVCGTGEGMCHIDESGGYDDPAVEDGTEVCTSDRTEDHWVSCDADCVYPHSLIEGVARSQAGKFNRNAPWVELEDVRQEAWLAYWEKREEIDSLLAQGDRTKGRYLIRDAVYRYCRREKAQRGGFDVEDEHFYSLKALRAALPAAFGGDVAGEGGTSVEPRRATRGGSVSGSDADTTLIDIRRGLQQLSRADRQNLFEISCRAAETLPDNKAGKTSLRRLQQALGGAPST